MNQSRLKDFIGVMYRAKKYNCIDMRCFQSTVVGTPVAYSEDELHAYGKTACAAGYLALSAEWREAGGDMGCFGDPIFDFVRGAFAIMKFLECTIEIAGSIVHGDMVNNHISSYYNKPLGGVKAQDVIDKLEGFLA